MCEPLQRKISYLENQKKLYGTTIYVGEVELDTIYGLFTGFTYQDLIHKGHIIACCFGNLHQANQIFIRMHSSCVTSEHLRSLDCDCVQQMEGAFKKISQEGCGILFYLIQEGRGCGYILKSKGCQITQYHEHDAKPIDTFESYKLMGLAPDYRDYRNIKDIAHLLGIADKQFVLMTNNPDKVEGFKQQGLRLHDKCVTIEFVPGPFNCEYLKSKKQFGHLLMETKKKVQKFKIPHQIAKPFPAYNVPKLQRFIHVASYYLPIKPVNNMLSFSHDELVSLREKLQPQEFGQLAIQEVSNKYFVQFPNEQMISKHSELAAKPYWFRSQVYYDLGSSLDYIVLTHNYEIDQRDNTIVPIVRVQSESIFDRFPLKDPTYKKRYIKTIQDIVLRGKGAIIIMYKDGRGSGLSHKILSTLKKQHGITDDSRDFDAAAKLLQHYMHDKPIEIYIGSNSYINLRPILCRLGLNIVKYMAFDDKSQSVYQIKEEFGHESIKGRIQGLDEYINKANQCLKNAPWEKLDSEVITFTTGIGSSQINSRFLELMVPDIVFKSAQVLRGMQISPSAKLICFSQGLTPNIDVVVNKFQITNVTFVTSISGQALRQGRKERYIAYKNSGAKFIQYPQEVPDDTLLRVAGPIAAFLAAVHYKNFLLGIKIDLRPRILKPSASFLNAVLNCGFFMLVAPSELLACLKNIQMKFLEGAFQEMPIVCDHLNFSHGFYQYAVSRGCPLLCICPISKQMRKSISKTLYFEEIDISGDIGLVELEGFMNYVCYELITAKSVNQSNWPGKQEQKLLYEQTV